MKPFLLLLISLTALKGASQIKLVPNKNSFEKKWVANDIYDMSWYVINDTSKLEIGKTTTQIIKNNKTLTIITTVNLKNTKAIWIDSTIAEITTLKPIYHSSHNMQRDMVLNFGKVVTGYYNDKSKKKINIISDTTNVDYFDSNLYPSLIGWLPLKNGYKQEISIYDYNPSAKEGVLKASVNEVKSGEYKNGKDEIRKVWIVTVTDEIGNGTATYYFDKTDRKLWKQEINIGNRKMLMQRVEH